MEKKVNSLHHPSTYARFKIEANPATPELSHNNVRQCQLEFVRHLQHLEIFDCIDPYPGVEGIEGHLTGSLIQEKRFTWLYL